MSSSVHMTSSARPLSAGRAMGWYAGVAAAAGLLDWVTKLLAVNVLAGDTHMLGDHLGLMLVFNKGAAGGASWGPHTWLINVGVTSFAVLMITMVVAPLARVH